MFLPFHPCNGRSEGGRCLGKEEPGVWESEIWGSEQSFQPRLHLWNEQCRIIKELRTVGGVAYSGLGDVEGKQLGCLWLGLPW